MKADQHLRELLGSAVLALQVEKVLPNGSDIRVDVERPKDSGHGDFTSNVALVLARQAQMAPRDLASQLIERLPESDRIARTEIAGPGFINFFLEASWRSDTLRDILERKDSFGQSRFGSGQKVQIEFVSANPTGPLHIGTGRNAAFGDSLARLLETAGFEVSREYLVNDYGRQLELFAQSLAARYEEALGRQSEIPADGYRGEYLIAFAQEIVDAQGPGWVGRLDLIKQWGLKRMVGEHRRTLARFGIEFDNWFSESSMHEAGRVRQAIEQLTQLGHTFEHERALWFRSEVGSRDQVLVRSDGQPSYFAHDIAYLLDKKQRGFNKAIYVWGADHHGNVETLRAAARILGAEGFAEIIVYQLVNFLQAGKAVRMAKRTGDLVTLDELIDEVGVDAIRYTLINRSTDQTIDFDFALVKAKSMENPVYRVQYSHARMASILRYAADQGIPLASPDEANLPLLDHPSEEALIRKLSEFPDLVEKSALLRAVHPVALYALDLAGSFNAFYRDCRVISDDRELSVTRLWLTEASRQVLSNSLKILGVTAPEKM